MDERLCKMLVSSSKTAEERSGAAVVSLRLPVSCLHELTVSVSIWTMTHRYGLNNEMNRHADTKMSLIR